MKDEEIPTLVLPKSEDATVEALAYLQELLFRHPIAAQALFRAFVLEGRAFEATPSGQAWKKRLSRSDFVRQGRVVWDSVTLNALDDRAETVLPTAILEAFTKAIASADVHAVLANVLDSAIARGAPSGDAE